MNSSIFRLTLDMHRTQSQISIPVMLGDTGITLRIILSDGGKPYTIKRGCLAKLSVKRPTGKHLEEFCTIEDDTTIVYDFSRDENTRKTAVVEGTHECDITLYGTDGSQIATPRFTMVVSQRVINSDDIDLTDDDLTAVDAMLAKEATRQLAESEREEAEAKRREAETKREEAEAKRSSGFIRYSAYSDGSNFTETWSEGQTYIGFATGQTAPTDKSGYTWMEIYNSNVLNKKVDKATPNADYTVLYALKSNGEHTTQRLTPHAVGNTVMFRDANGYCKVGEPAKDEHIANKRYVDKANQAMQADIDTLEALADKLNKQLNPPVNVWKIREDADIWSVSITENIRFYANDIEFDTIQIGDPFNHGDPHLWYDYQGMRYTYLMGMSESHPNSYAYLTIKIPYDEKLSAEFTSWLEANAEYLGEEEYVRPEPSEMITFSVCNYMYATTHELTCPEGMTWGEYFYSGYCESSKIMLSYFDPDGMIVQISDESYSSWYSYIFYGINSETVIEDGGDYSGDEYFG